MGWLKDAWYWPGKPKREAVAYWPELAGRTYDVGHALSRQPHPAAKLLGALRKGDALAYYAAGAAAELASESVHGWALDALSLGRGKIASGVVTGITKQAARLLKPGGTGAKALARTTAVAQQWSEPGSALLLGRKAVKGVTVAGRAAFGGEPAGAEPAWQPPHREPFRQVSLDIHPELPSARASTRPLRSRAPVRSPWSASYVDPIKLAAAQLRGSRPAPYQPLGGPGSSTLDKLRELERRSVEHERTQAWLRGVSRELERGIRTPDIFDRRAMELHRAPAPHARPVLSPPVRQPAAPPAATQSLHRPLSWYAQGLR